MIFVTHDQVEALSLGDRVAVMDGGRLLQVGTPQEIYRRPANLFVAGFVGSPSINRLPLCRDAEGHLAGGPFRFAGDWPGDEATLGVRPEDLRVEAGAGVRSDAAGGAAAGSAPTGGHPALAHADFEATVVRVESLGSEQRVHLDGPGDDAWIARAPPVPEVAAGDRVAVSVAWDRGHLFGPDGSRMAAAPCPIADLLH